jgi:hypothetical protein
LNSEPRGLWAVFRWPTLLALLSIAGLLAALLGDGAWDALSWLLLGVPVLIGTRGLQRATRRG